VSIFEAQKTYMGNILIIMGGGRSYCWSCINGLLGRYNSHGNGGGCSLELGVGSGGERRDVCLLERGGQARCHCGVF